MRLRTLRESLSSDLIDLGDITDYHKPEKVGEIGEYEIYTYDEGTHKPLLAVSQGKIVGECSFSNYKNTKYDGFPVHTAHVEPEFRRKGLYRDLLVFAKDWLGGDVISLPYDDDSDEPRSAMASEFWAKNGQVIGGTKYQPIYKLK